MAQKNLYDALGVTKGADLPTIKRAYRKLAKKYHPDKNQGDASAEARFKEASSAYEVLADKTRRSHYDEFGEESLRQGFDAEQARAHAQWQNQAGGFGGQGFGGQDIFGDLFGFGQRTQGHSRRNVPLRGDDIRAELNIDFMTAVLGGERSIKFSGGREIQVRIPAGARDGGSLRLRGQGSAGANSGPSGDLLLKLNVAAHPLYTRDGENLHINVPITLGEAMRGGHAMVPTPTGEVKLKIPPSTQTDKKLRLRGKGVVRKGASPGDLYVHLKVHTPQPEELSPELLAALDVIEQAYKEHPRQLWPDAYKVNA